MTPRTHRQGGAGAYRAWLCLGLSCCLALGCNGQTHTVLGYGAVNADADATGTLSLSAEQLQAAIVPSGERPDASDRTGGALRVIDVPGFSRPKIIHSPAGWLALSWRELGYGKNPSGAQSSLYRSLDGVHWVSIPLTPQHDDLALVQLAYGAGRYMMLGRRYTDTGGDVVWTSLDAEHWSETRLAAEDVQGLPQLSYVHERFFVVSFNRLAVSETGLDWKAIPFSLIQGGAAAYGNGVYLLAGNGPMETSEDGWSWQEHALDCSLPDACLGGTDHQFFHTPPIFAEGRFYSGSVRSVDGANWEPSDAPGPNAYASGRFWGIPLPSRGVDTWASGGDVQTLRVIRPVQPVLGPSGPNEFGVHGIYNYPPPDHVDVAFEDGLTCETASCFALGVLLMVPPAGTPPLSDHVPRNAEGAPILGELCPNPGMIFCDDYQARTSCVCDPDAPELPQLCEDPVDYHCEGQFTLRPNEWTLGDVVPGGCSCGTALNAGNAGIPNCGEPRCQGNPLCHAGCTPTLAEFQELAGEDCPLDYDSAQPLFQSYGKCSSAFFTCDGVRAAARQVSDAGESVQCYYDDTGALQGALRTSDSHGPWLGGQLPPDNCYQGPSCGAPDAGI